jgi:L-iditol 2-dehydrogenase
MPATQSPPIPDTCLGAALVAYGEPLELRELQMPKEIEPGAVLVKMQATTLCGSDVHFWEGELTVVENILPALPGHEFVGEIVKLGPGVETDSVGTPLAIGDRLVWEHEACGSCYACSVQRQGELCENRRHYMYLSCLEYPYLTGGLAQYCYIFPKAGRLRVPDELKSDWAAASSCALRTVMHAFERIGRVAPWETVVIQGAGPLGLFATAVARRSGAAKIITIGAPEERLALAREWGADETVTVEGSDPEQREAQILELTGGKGGDVVMEFSGGRGAVREALDFVRPGGRIVVIGQVGPREDPFIPSTITRKNVTMMGSWSATIAHYWQALEFLRLTHEHVDYDALISGHFSLEDSGAALEGMRALTEIKPAIWPNGKP